MNDLHTLLKQAEDSIAAEVEEISEFVFQHPELGMEEKHPVLTLSNVSNHTALLSPPRIWESIQPSVPSYAAAAENAKLLFCPNMMLFPAMVLKEMRMLMPVVTTGLRQAH